MYEWDGTSHARQGLYANMEGKGKPWRILGVAWRELRREDDQTAAGPSENYHQRTDLEKHQK